MMSIKGFLEEQRLKILHSKRMTISGEINILTMNIGESILMDDVLFSEIESYSKTLKSSYPYLKIETLNELHQITIKIFAYNKSFSDQGFIEKFNQSLKELLYQVEQLGDLKSMVNVYGEINTLSKIDKFRFVNDGVEVYNKITDTIHKNEISVIADQTIGKIFGREKEE